MIGISCHCLYLKILLHSKQYRNYQYQLDHCPKNLLKLVIRLGMPGNIIHVKCHRLELMKIYINGT